MELLNRIRKALFNERTKDEQFRKITEEMAALYEKKNADYGGNGKSVGEQMFDKYGDEYYVMMLMQKVLRVESLTNADRVNFESIEDTYRDIANYAVMALMCHMEGGAE